jgi:hypothetical protein
VEALVAELRDREIDVLIVDPFVSSHACPENDNGAIDAIAKKWARVGVMAKCSIVLVHHTGKLAGAEASAEKARGASSLTGAARSVVALNKMTDVEASGFGIEGEERRRFFRAYDDKNNRAPPADHSEWFQILSVDLGNDRLGELSDSVPVVVPWAAPDAFDGVRLEHLIEVQGRVREADYRKDPQSPDWVGEAVAAVLELDVSDRKGRDCARVKKLLRSWFDYGVLIEERAKDEKRRDRTFVRVGRTATLEDAPR